MQVPSEWCSYFIPIPYSYIPGVTVNLGLFIIATLALYELSWKMFKDEYLAYKSALFFCINPASIFFSATYSESLHAALSFLLMAKIEKGLSFQVGFLLILASFCRSNALLNIGFIVYKTTKLIVNEVVRYKWLKQLKVRYFLKNSSNHHYVQFSQFY